MDELAIHANKITTFDLISYPSLSKPVVYLVDGIFSGN
ncbi:unnamed protein product [Acidocella sp. C78]|nr:unnamed protein product [Acidocella sp. C78]